MTPEEILFAGLNPITAAVGNYAQGKTQLAQADYVNAVRQANDATNFARQAKEARALLQQRLEGEQKLSQARDESAAKREDARQKAMLDRASEEEKLRIQRGLIIQLGKEGVAALPRQAGQTLDDHIIALSKQISEKSDKNVNDAANAIIALNDEAERIMNPESDPAKAEQIKAQMDLSLRPVFLAQLQSLDDQGNPVYKNGEQMAEKIQKNLAAGLSLEAAVMAVSPQLRPVLENVRTVTKAQIASGLAAPEDKLRLSGLQRAILQLQGSDPQIGVKVGMAMAEKLKTRTATKPGGGGGLPGAGGLPAGLGIAPGSSDTQLSPPVTRDEVLARKAAMAARAQGIIAPTAQDESGVTIPAGFIPQRRAPAPMVMGRPAPLTMNLIAAQAAAQQPPQDVQSVIAPPSIPVLNPTNTIPQYPPTPAYFSGW